MRVKIGKYVNWIGPYQIAEKLLFWRDKYDDDSVHALGEKLSNIPYLTEFCQLVHSKLERNTKVHIDDFDVWNLDSTLALIILPALRKLQEQKQGSGFVDIEDLPKHLQYDTTEEYDLQKCFDFYHAAEDKLQVDVHTKYEWLLSELIWTFEFIVADSEGKVEYNPEEYKRQEKGLRLFGKYYRTLWT